MIGADHPKDAFRRRRRNALGIGLDARDFWPQRLRIGSGKHPNIKLCSHRGLHLILLLEHLKSLTLP